MSEFVCVCVCACISVCICLSLFLCLQMCVFVFVCLCVILLQRPRPNGLTWATPPLPPMQSSAKPPSFSFSFEQLWSLTGLSLSKHFDRFYIISFTYLISLVMNNISQTIRNIICMWMTFLSYLKIFEILCVWYLVHLGLRDSKQSVSGIRWILWKATTCACPHQETCLHFTFSRYSDGAKKCKKGLTQLLL